MKVWVVIDVGCHECGVGSEPVGMFLTERAANDAAKGRDEETHRWRDGGQTYAVVFEMSTPDAYLEAIKAAIEATQEQRSKTPDEELGPVPLPPEEKP